MLRWLDKVRTHCETLRMVAMKRRKRNKTNVQTDVDTTGPQAGLKEGLRTMKWSL